MLIDWMLFCIGVFVVYKWRNQIKYSLLSYNCYYAIHSSAKLQSPPIFVFFFCSHEVYHKQEVLTRSDVYLTIITLIHWIKIYLVLLHV